MKHIFISKTVPDQKSYKGKNQHLICDVGVIVTRKRVEPVQVVTWQEIDALAGFRDPKLKSNG